MGSCLSQDTGGNAMEHISQWLADMLRQGARLDRQLARFVLLPPSHFSPEQRAVIEARSNEIHSFWNEPVEAELSPFSLQADAPLSPAQERALNRLDIQGESFQLLFHLEGSLVPDQLEKILQHLVSQEDTLRTVFPASDSWVSQRVLADYVPALTVVEAKPSTEPAQLLARFEGLQHSLHEKVASRPPWRALLLRFSATQNFLLIFLHPTIADGASATLLAKKLSQSLVPCPRDDTFARYTTYARWLQHYWQSERLGVQLAYWDRCLKGLPETTVLPVDKPGLALQSYQAGRHCLLLTAAKLNTLVETAQSCGHSLEIILLSIWVSLLSRFTSKGNVPLAVSARTPEYSVWKNLLGPFENPVLIHADLSNRPTFRVLATRLEHMAREISNFCYAPIQAVVETVLEDNHQGRHPMRAAFAYYELPRPSQMAGVTMRVVDVVHVPIARDVSLIVNLTHQGLCLAIHYDAARFEDSTITRLALYLKNMLCKLPTYLDQAVDVLPLLDGTAKAEILSTWNNSESTSDDQRLLFHFFEERVAQRPAAIALRTVADPMLGTIDLSYSLLDDWANRIARSLTAQGVRPGTLVGIYLFSSADAVAVMLGILRAGAAYVPLDPHSPPDHIASMIADTAMKWIITRVSLSGQLSAFSKEVVVLTTDQGDALAGAETDLPNYIDPSQLAYVVYTSGSTGQAKGVSVPHKNMVQLINAIDWLDMGPGQVVLQASSLAFDAAFFEIWGCLSQGGTLVMPGERSLDHLPDIIRRQNITTLWLTSHLFRFMVEEHLEDMAMLSQVVSGGDVLSPLHVAHYLEKYPHHLLINGYGLSEATIFTTYCNLSSRGLAAHTAPIGKPITNACVFLLDRELNPVPVGVRGEIYVAGPSLARGYFNRSALTAARFIPSPFACLNSGSSPGGQRLYRTGDVGRFLADGHLEFLGRRDYQVKIRDYRVDLTEVERTLAEHARVKQAVILPHIDCSGTRFLSAYVCVECIENKSAETDDELKVSLRQFLTKKLPLDLIPHSFVVLSELPLTPAGKLDREALPNPLTNVSDQDSFEQHLTRVMDVDEFTSEVPALKRVIHDGNLPQSLEQKEFYRLVDEEHDSQTQIAGNLGLCLQLRGTLAPALLEQALWLLASRHEILRTTFPDPLTQRVGQPSAQTLTVINLAAQKAEFPLNTMAEQLLRAVRQPYQLKSPAWQYLLFHEGKHANTLLLQAHSMVADERTLLSLAHELMASYRLLARTDNCSELAISFHQYADYVFWQKAWLAGDEASGHRNFWRRYLEAAPALLRLPTEGIRGHRRSYHGASHFFTLPENLIEGLAAISRQAGCTLAVFCQAAFSILLAHYSGQQDFVVGLFVHRGHDSLGSMAGPVNNVLPVRQNLSGDPDFWKLLERTRTRVRQARSHWKLPYSEIRVAAEWSGNHSILFSWDMHLEPYQLPGLQVQPAWQSNGTALFDLHLRLKETNGKLVAHLAYAADLFEAQTIKRMANHLLHLMATLAKSPDIRLSRISLLTEQERDALLRVFNDTRTSSPRDRCLPRLFEDMATRLPHQVALHCPARALSLEAGRITFNDLNKKANLLAAYLRRLGVGSEILVGLSMGDSPALAFAVLAVFKAGGVCLLLKGEQEMAQELLCSGQVPVVLLGPHVEIEDYPGQVVRLDHEGGLGATPPREQVRSNPPDIVRPEHGAVLFFEEAGEQGALISHHTLSNAIWWYKTHLKEGGTSLLYARPHDLHLFHELFSSWCGGGTLMIVPRQRLNEPVGLARLLNGECITRLSLPSWRFRQLAEVVAQDMKPAALNEVIVYGAVPMVSSAVKAFKEQLGDGLYFCVGNPLVPMISMTSINEKALSSYSQVLVDRPVDNSRIYLLDRYMNPVPIGVTGTLYVGGAMLPRCLWGSRTTAQELIPDPYNSCQGHAAGGSRLLNTGYMARFKHGNNDLAVELRGTLTSRVSRNGYPLNLAAISAVLEQHPSVLRADISLTPKTALLPNMLQAKVWVPMERQKTKEAALIEELRRFASKALPSHAQPDQIALATEADGGNVTIQ